MSQTATLSTKTCSLVDVVVRHGDELGDKKLYTFLDHGTVPGKTLTFNQLDSEAQRVAGYLQERLRPGDRVLLMMPNRLDFAIAFLGCLYARIVAVPTSIAQSAGALPRFKKLVQASGASLVLTNGATERRVHPLLEEDHDAASVERLLMEDLPESHWKRPAIRSDDLAFIQFTSGSTGDPKGVMVSHGNILHNLGLLESAFEPRADACIVSWLPFFHDWGLVGGLLQPAYLGATSVILDPLDFLVEPLRWLEAISRFHGSISGAPNFAYDLCLRRVSDEQLSTLDLSRWDVAILGAEPVRHKTLEQFSTRFAPCGFRPIAFYPSYGLAESTLAVTGADRNRAPREMTVNRDSLGSDRVEISRERTGNQTLVSCGPPLENQKIAIVNPRTSKRCAPNEVGEIWVTGPSIALGYWQDDGETERAFRAHISGSEEEAYLRTGDLGYVWDGELYVTGRSKDLIILAGRNIYPQDLEVAAEGSHPSLRPGCGAAFSIDGATSERLVLVHELNYGPRPDSDEVIGAIQRALASTERVFADIIAIANRDAFPRLQVEKSDVILVECSLSAESCPILPFGRAGPESQSASTGKTTGPWR